MPLAPQLSIVIPTWNNLEMLKLCLSSVRRHSEVPHEVIVHVNEGSDGTAAWVRRQNVRHTWTPHNVGICRALNLAFEQCRSDYIVYLNDDMYVLPGWDRPLLERLAAAGDRQPCYVAGTMIQASPISPGALTADYGPDPGNFREDQLLQDAQAGRFQRSDWNGATWPPCCIHRRWWELVDGYDERFSPGFYSDIDFSMKLWDAGCRRFLGVGSSLVYHFSEKTTSLVRGPHKCEVKKARVRFLKKWGILPTTFKKHYLQIERPPMNVLPNASLRGDRWERTRLQLMSAFHRLPLPGRAA